jgi:chloramphenicol-sensitive protein RarD
MRDSAQSTKLTGYFYAATAFFTWGFHPFFWKQLIFIPPFELLAHRVVWSTVFVGILFFALRPAKILPALRIGKTRNFLLLTTVLIALNWFLYIYSIYSDQIVQASLGYYINPLMNILFGTLFLKERLDRLQKTALVISLIGVLYLTFDYGRVPWLSIAIATAFSLYGLFKKLTPIDSLAGLFVETALLGPFAAAYLIAKGIAGTGAMFMSGGVTDILLVLGGIVTSFPLFLFGKSTKLIPLSSVGFFQYMAPSMMLLIGIFWYGEIFTPAHAVCFGCIWTALGIYSYSLIRDMKKPSRTVPVG